MRYVVVPIDAGFSGWSPNFSAYYCIGEPVEKLTKIGEFWVVNHDYLTVQPNIAEMLAFMPNDLRGSCKAFQILTPPSDRKDWGKKEDIWEVHQKCMLPYLVIVYA